MAQQKQTLLEWAGTEKRQVALVMTDIIGSTELAKGGDDNWVEMLKTHFRRARALRDHYNGYEIKLIGDAYMAIFHTGDEALGFAKDFIVDTGLPEIFIRVAIHVGRIVISEGDIYGIMVNYTSRLIGSLAQRRMRIPEPSGIVISQAAKSQIIAAHGKQIEGILRDFPADLRSFGKDTACFYAGQDALISVLARRRRMRELAAESAAKEEKSRRDTANLAATLPLRRSQPPVSPSSTLAPPIRPIRSLQTNKDDDK